MRTPSLFLICRFVGLCQSFLIAQDLSFSGTFDRPDSPEVDVSAAGMIGSPCAYDLLRIQ